jgi:hypothetical protein
MVIVQVISFLVSGIAFFYLAQHYWRRKSRADRLDRSAGFRPSIGFTHFDEMVSLSLLLENKCKYDVWAEELEIFLSELTAEDQTAEPSRHEVQRIRQLVPSDDTLPISLGQIIYKAAGGPQLNYSCVLSSVLRFRIGEERFERNLENYRVQMLGLTASGIQRERKPIAPFDPIGKPQDSPSLATKLK